MLGDFHLTHLLLKRGASLNVKDEDGLKPIDHAKNEFVVNLLLKWQQSSLRRDEAKHNKPLQNTTVVQQSGHPFAHKKHVTKEEVAFILRAKQNKMAQLSHAHVNELKKKMAEGTVNRDDLPTVNKDVGVMPDWLIRWEKEELKEKAKKSTQVSVATTEGTCFNPRQDQQRKPELNPEPSAASGCCMIL